MRSSILSHRLFGVLLVALATSTGLLSGAPRDAGQKPKAKAPQITLRSNVAVAMAPARIVVTAELVGGADDYADYYCPNIEWDWKDDTTSKENGDCDPYVAGKSEIRRRYTTEHRFNFAGVYAVTFRMLQGKKQVGQGQVTVQIDGEHPF